MSLFKKLFGGSRRSIEGDKFAIGQQVQAMATEADRVYRYFLQLYSDEFSPASPTGKGLCKARLHATTFMVYALTQLWPGRQEEILELANLASAVALSPLAEPNSNPSLDREEAKTFALDYMKRVLAAIIEEFNTGPSLPGCETDGFRELADLYHDSLRDSIGKQTYTPEVKSRFDHLVKSGISSALRHAAEVVQKTGSTAN